jgi:hypothetical protein
LTLEKIAISEFSDNSLRSSLLFPAPRSAPALPPDVQSDASAHCIEDTAAATPTLATMGGMRPEVISPFQSSVSPHMNSAARRIRPSRSHSVNVRRWRRQAFLDRPTRILLFFLRRIDVRRWWWRHLPKRRP